MERRFRKSRICFRSAAALLLASLPLALALPPPRKGKLPRDLAEILSRMDESAKRLKTLSANLEYTKVTVLVNDKSTEFGHIFFHKSKSPEILLNFEKPDPKVILFKKNKAEVYLPKINQIQEYDFAQQGELVQHFLALGFGSESGDLKKDFELKYAGEEELDGDSTVVIELTPRKEALAARLSKIQLWISEESWLPVQQKFFEPGGDYVIARYTAVKVNRQLPGSTFQIPAAQGAKRVEMNQ